MFNPKLVPVLGCVTLVAAVFACESAREPSRTTGESLIGLWSAVDTADGILGSGKILRFEFFEDGTVSFVDKSYLGEKSWTGSYSPINDSTVKFDFGITQYVLTVSIQDAVLAVSAPEGGGGTYRKVRD